MDHLRVVVQLESDIPEDDNENQDSSNDNSGNNDYVKWRKNSCIYSQKSPTKRTSVRLGNNKTILLKVKDISTDYVTTIVHKMSFDQISHATNRTVLTLEVTDLVEELLLQGQNVCMVWFSARSKCQITYIYKLFMEEISSRLETLNLLLQYIRIECKDIRRNETRVMLQPVSSDAQRNSVPEGLFRNMQELLWWLTNVYESKWCDIEGHDLLVLHFFVLDAEQRFYKVRLVLCNVYLERMDTEARMKWSWYMKALGDNKEAKFKHIQLTANLRDHFEGIGSSKTTLIFNVPAENCGSPDTLELFQLANAVMRNRKIRISKRKPVKLQRECSLHASSLPAAGQPWNHAGEDLPSTTQQDARSLSPMQRSVSFTVPLEQEDQITAAPNNTPTSTAPERYSKKDLISLSALYHKIDEQFFSMHRIMESQHKHHCEQQMAEMCLKLKNLAHGTESLQLMLTQSMDIVAGSTSDELMQQCSQSLIKLKQLSDEVEQSNYAELLRAYMETKSFDLSQHMLRFKIAKMEEIVKTICETTDKELVKMRSKLATFNQRTDLG